MTPFDLITREEVLGGLPARQASTLLFLIETRTAHLIRQSRQVTERFLTEDAEKERELAFYEAFTLGRNPYPPPSIQHLERYAPQWALLVPKTPALRAAIARALGQKYRFTREAVPAIRAALTLDDETVRLAYQRLYGQPLEENRLRRRAGPWRAAALGLGLVLDVAGKPAAFLGRLRPDPD